MGHSAAHLLGPREGALHVICLGHGANFLLSFLGKQKGPLLQEGTGPSYTIRKTGHTGKLRCIRS